MTEKEIPDGMRVEYGTPIYRYRGYDIRFNENSDEWSCHTLNVSHAQLSVVKDMVGKIDAKARKLDGIPVLVLDTHSAPTVVPAQAQLLDADQKGVWVNLMTMSGPGYNRRAVEKREKKDRSSLIEDTPENRATVEALAVRYKAAYAELSAIRAEGAAIPRWKPPVPQEVEALPEEQSQKVAARPIRARTRR